MIIGDCKILNNVNNVWICSFGGVIKKTDKGHHYCNMFCNKSMRNWNYSVMFVQDLNDKISIFLYVPIP